MNGNHDHAETTNGTHDHAHRDCCGRKLHVEGEEAVAHMMHALEVRNDWLSSAMAEAEDEDRRTGVWRALRPGVAHPVEVCRWGLLLDRRWPGRQRHAGGLA